MVKTIRPIEAALYPERLHRWLCVLVFGGLCNMGLIRWLEQNGSTPIDDLPLSDQRVFILIMLGGFFLAMWGFMRLVDWWNRLMR